MMLLNSKILYIIKLNNFEIYNRYYKDYLDALSKNLDVITSDEISSQEDFHKVLISKTEIILKKMKLIK